MINSRKLDPKLINYSLTEKFLNLGVQEKYKFLSLPI